MTMEIPFQDMFYFDGRYYLSLFSYDYSYSNRLEIGFGLIKNLNKTISTREQSLSLVIAL